MIHRILAVLLFSSVVALAQDAARMDEIVQARAKGDRFMGSVLVAKGDTVLFEKSYGWANVEWRLPHTRSTKFRIGSVTKQFTAAAILLLEEKGKLKTDDRISNYIPATPEAWKDVTIYQLLTHTSGIPSFTDLPDYGTSKLLAEAPEKSVARVKDKPLEFVPGERFKYSNTGYVLLGWIVEIVSGKTYEAFLQESILGPLSMGDTGYDWNEAIVPERASGYVWSAGGLANAPFIDMHVPHGAGALYSTPRDLHRWMQGLFGGKLLSAAALEKMITPHKDNYACGLMSTTLHGEKAVWHAGGIEGFNAYVAHYPQSKVTVVVTVNVNVPTIGEIASQLSAVALGQQVLLPSERKEIKLSEETLRRYVGVYQVGPKVTNTIRFVDGTLTTQLSGQAAHPMFAESETKFFLKVVDAQAEFVTDAKGRVTHLNMIQNGRTRSAPRISDTVVERKAVNVARATLDAYVGTYELRPGFDIVITREGDQLMSQATGQGKAPLFAASETKFFLKVVDAEIEFFKDAAGAVTHLMLHQGGHDVKGARK